MSLVDHYINVVKNEGGKRATIKNLLRARWYIKDCDPAFKVNKPNWVAYCEAARLVYGDKFVPGLRRYIVEGSVR